MSLEARVEEGADCNNDIHQDAKDAFQVIALLVSKEVAHTNDAEDQHDRLKVAKIQIHSSVQTPAYYDHEWRVEESGHDRTVEDVR